MAEILDIHRELPCDVLRAFRRSRRLTQAQLARYIAEKANEEWMPSTVSDLERDRIRWRLSFLWDIACAYWQEPDRCSQDEGDQDAHDHEPAIPEDRKQIRDTWEPPFLQAWSYYQSLTKAQVEKIHKLRNQRVQRQSGWPEERPAIGQPPEQEADGKQVIPQTANSTDRNTSNAFEDVNSDADGAVEQQQAAEGESSQAPSNVRDTMTDATNQPSRGTVRTKTTVSGGAQGGAHDCESQWLTAVHEMTFEYGNRPARLRRRHRYTGQSIDLGHHLPDMENDLRLFNQEVLDVIRQPSERTETLPERANSSEPKPQPMVLGVPRRSTLVYGLVLAGLAMCFLAVLAVPVDLGLVFICAVVGFGGGWCVSGLLQQIAPKWLV